MKYVPSTPHRPLLSDLVRSDGHARVKMKLQDYLIPVRLQRHPLPRRVRRVCQGRRQRHPDEDLRHQSRPEPAHLHLLPTLWFRNEWSRSSAASEPAPKSRTLEQIEAAEFPAVSASRRLPVPLVLSSTATCAAALHQEQTNHEQLFPGDCRTRAPYVKDGINDFVVNDQQQAVNPEKQGTKVAAHYKVNVGASQTAVILVAASLEQRT